MLDDRTARTNHHLSHGVHSDTASPKLYVNQEEFGELAGLNRQASNSSMKILERAGLVTMHYGFIPVKDFDGLARYRRVTSSSADHCLAVI
jgi:hypothetical protein